MKNIYGTVNFKADRLENLCFNPLDYFHRGSDLTDLDPDCNFLKESSSSCYYFFEGQLNELLVNENDLDLPILHLNARSVYGNFGKFKQLLRLVDPKLSVIGISETWLNDSTLDLVDIRNGYNFVSNYRVNKTGDGVALYLLDEFEFKIRSDLKLHTQVATRLFQFAEINIPWGKNVIVGTIYRPPDENVNDFLD